MFNSIVIANKFVPKEELIRVYHTVLLAQKIHEESYNDRGFYNKTHDESAIEAVQMNGLDVFWINVISNWNYYCWNDIQHHSEEFIQKENLKNNPIQVDIQDFIKQNCKN